MRARPSRRRIYGWSNVPNDILGNFGIVSGSSQLLMLTDQALAHAQAAYLADHPEYSGSLSSAPVMLGGFSQGGITAGEFAEQFSSKYNITQVVTVGAGLGNAEIAPVNGMGNPVSVIAYEATLDPVPRADGASNPSWFTTVTGDNGWGDNGSHDAQLYAQMAANNPNAVADSNLDVFFADPQGAEVTDYFATKG